MLQGDGVDHVYAIGSAQRDTGRMVMSSESAGCVSTCCALLPTRAWKAQPTTVAQPGLSDVSCDDVRAKCGPSALLLREVWGVH